MNYYTIDYANWYPKIETENVIKRCNALNKQAKVTTYILNKKEMNEFIENMKNY